MAEGYVVELAAEAIDPSMDPALYRIDDGAITILASRSDSSGSLFWPRRLGCPETGGTVSETELPSIGVVWSWTHVSAPWPGTVAPSVAGGYCAGLVDLDDNGPRVVGVLMGERDDWEVGARVRGTPLPFMETGGVVRSILAFSKDVL